jgi:hypothetical protein
MARSRPLAGIAAVVTAVVVLASCSGESGSSLPKPSDAFCTAARRYDDQLGKLTATGTERFTKQIAWVEPLAAHAPKDVKHDAEVFLDALRRRADGDASVAKDPDVEAAIKHLNRRAAQGCDFYVDNSGSGI